MKRKIADLGFAVVVIETNSPNNPFLSIFQPAEEHEGGREIPAKSITLYGLKPLWAVKKLLDELFKDAKPEEIKGWENHVPKEKSPF